MAFARLYSAYLGGVLPRSGGMLEQPAVLLDAFDYYRGLDDG